MAGFLKEDHGPRTTDYGPRTGSDRRQKGDSDRINRQIVLRVLLRGPWSVVWSERSERPRLTSPTRN